MKKRMCTDAIVVFNGCFCPVHAGHVQAMMDTKRKVEADGQFKVVAGYFAVATDGFVRRKVDRLEPWMAAAARVDMCKAVAEDVNWNISAAEFAGWKQCGAAMVANNHSSKTKVFGVRDEAKKGGVCKKGSHVLMASDCQIADLSSTKIRAEFARRGCTPRIVDELVEQRVLGRAVGECLKQKLGQKRAVESWVNCICCEGTGKLLDSECPLCDGLARFPAEKSEEEGFTVAAEPLAGKKCQEASSWSEKDGRKSGRKHRT